MKKKQPRDQVKKDKKSNEPSPDTKTKGDGQAFVQPDAKATSGAKPPEKPKTPETPNAGSNAGKPKRWRRRFVKALLVVVVLVFLFRLSLSWVIPVVINRAANHYDLAASVERVELSVLGTDAGLWHLKVSPKEGGKELASIDYVRVKVATWALLTGNLHLRRAEAEGVTLQLHRNADGRLPLLDRVLASLPKSNSPKESTPGEITLAPPLQVDALRLSNLKIVFFDEFADPSIQSDVVLNLTLSDLDSPVRPARFDLELRADPILDFLHVKGMAYTSERELEADLDFQLRGLHPHAIEGYLQLAGLKPVAQRINATMAGKAHLSLVDGATTQPTSQPTSQSTSPSTSQPMQATGATSSTLSAVQGRLTLSDISLTADDASAVGLEKLTLDISTLKGNLANFAMLDIQGVTGNVKRNAQGNIQFAGLALDGGSSAETSETAESSTKHASSQPATDTSNAATEPRTNPVAEAEISAPIEPAKAKTKTSDFRWRLGGVDMRRLSLSFRDEMVKPTVDLSVVLDRLTLSAPDSQAFDVTTTVNVSGQGSAPGLADVIELTGEFRPFQTPLDLQARLKIAHIRPVAIEPYLKMLKIESQLSDATLAMELQASWTPHDDGSITGDLSLNNVKLQDQGLNTPGPLFDLDRLSIANLAIAPDFKRLSVEAVELQGTRVSAKRDTAGNIQMLGFRTQLQGATHNTPLHSQDAASGVSAAVKAPEPQPADHGVPAAADAAAHMAPVFKLQSKVSPEIMASLTPAPAPGPSQVASPAQSPTTPQPTTPAALHVTSQAALQGETSPLHPKVTDEEVAAMSFKPLDMLAQLPHLSVGSFSWKDVDLTWEDQMVSPAIKSHVTDAGVLFSDFVFDPNSEPLSGQPATLRVWLGARDVFGNVNLAGKILTGGKGVSVHVDLLADELHSKVILPYLDPFGFEPVMQRGRLVLTGQAQVVRGPERWLVGARLDRLKLTDGDQHLASVDHIDLVDLTLRDGRLGTQRLNVDKPYLQALRSQDGSFVLLGIKIHPGAQLPPPAKDALTSLVETFSHIEGSIAQLKVTDATLDWQDQVVTPAVMARTVAQTSLKGFELGQGHASGELDASMAVSDTIKQLRVQGRLSLVDKSPHIKLSVTGDGLNAGQVKSYLPAGMDLPWQDGALKVQVDAGFHAHEQGGHAFDVALTDFDLRNGQADEPYLALKDAKVAVNRYDPAGGVVDLKEISAHGFETTIRRAKDGQLTIAGVSFGSAPAVEPAVAATTQPASAQADDAPPTATLSTGTTPTDTQSPSSPLTTASAMATAQPASVTANNVLAAVAVSDDTQQAGASQAAVQNPAAGVNPELAVILARRRQTAPLITLAKFDLHASSISVIDEMREKSSPLVIKELRLSNKERIEMLGPAAKDAPPIKLKLALEPSPIAKAVQVDLIAKPFDEQFRFGMAVEVSGINGQGLLAVLPELAEQLEADDLVDGVFTSRFGMAAKLDRPRPWQIDLSRGAVLNLGFGETSLRQSADGQILGGVKQVRIEDVQISPRWKQIRIQNADITGLTFNGWRDDKGLHVLGFTLPMTQEETAPAATTPAVQTATDSQANPAATPANTDTPEQTAQAPVELVKQDGQAKPEPPAMLVELNRLTVSGLDGKFEDRLVKPAVVLPLTGLDVDIRNVSNSFATQARPLRFNVLLTAGKVKVPVREQGLNVTGVLGDTARFITGNQTRTRRLNLVDRDLFSQITASGRIRFNPKPDGWVKFSINGLELWALRGMATQFGVELGGGVMDLSVDGRVEDDGSLDTRNRVILTDLSLREPSNGPISRYLALPAPLDAVLVAVRSSDGAITLPVNLTIRQGQVSKEQIMSQVLTSMSSVLTKAFTSSPMKIAGGVTSFVGVGGLMGGKSVKDYEPVVISYLPGHTAPEPPFSGMLDGLIKRMKSDTKLNVILRSQISLSDVQTASIRANPTRQECMEMIAELSQRVRELSFRRADVAGQVKAELASMASEQAQKSMEQLRLIDRQLVRTQEALDGVYELLRPGSPRQAMRRTRAAAIAIGQARLEYIAMKLYDSDIPNVLQRVQVTPAQFNPIDSSAEEVLAKAKLAEKAEEVEQSEKAGEADSGDSPENETAASDERDEQGQIGQSGQGDQVAMRDEDDDAAEPDNAAVATEDKLPVDASAGRDKSEAGDVKDAAKEQTVVTLVAEEDPSAVMGQVVITLVPTR